jgi:hypothetical protein
MFQTPTIAAPPPSREEKIEELRSEIHELDGQLENLAARMRREAPRVGGQIVPTPSLDFESRSIQARRNLALEQWAALRGEVTTLERVAGNNSKTA